MDVFIFFRRDAKQVPMYVKLEQGLKVKEIF